jgi:hypothetical protein
MERRSKSTMWGSGRRWHHDFILMTASSQDDRVAAAQVVENMKELIPRQLGQLFHELFNGEKVGFAEGREHERFSF